MHEMTVVSNQMLVFDMQREDFRMFSTDETLKAPLFNTLQVVS